MYDKKKGNKIQKSKFQITLQIMYKNRNKINLFPQNMKV